MSKPQLRAVNPDIEHPRDRAKRDVKRWRSNAEKQKLPVSNQSTGAPNLFVDEVLQRTLRDMPELHTKPDPWIPFVIALLAVLGGLLGLVWLVKESI